MAVAIGFGTINVNSINTDAAVAIGQNVQYPAFLYLKTSIH